MKLDKNSDATTHTAMPSEAVSRAKSSWDKFDELVAQIPKEAADRFPVDGAEEHDHYIYGTPKRNRK